MKILEITKEEMDQIENHLLKMDSKIERVETVIWYIDEEISDIPLRTQHMISIIEDYIKLLQSDIDTLYAMAGLKYNKNENAVPKTDQDNEELH